MKVIRAVGYIRVSTAEQARTGISLETQEAEIRLHAKQHNMTLTEIYIDKGITARKQLQKREAFMQMMYDVEAGKVDVILVMRLDRWFRNVYDYHRMMNEYLIPNRVDWCAIKEDYDTTTTNGRLMINLRLAIAEQECDTDSDRVKDVQGNMVRNHQWPYGRPPFGYKIENKRLVKNPDTEPHVEHFFEHFLQNGSMRAAICSVNKRFGATYGYEFAQKIAKRSFYYGEYKGIQEFCPAFITEEQRVRVAYLVGKNIRIHTSGETIVHLFTGLLICEDCKRRLNSQITKRNGKVYHSYRCQRSADNGLCVNNKSVREKVVEQFLLDCLETGLEGYIFTVQLRAKAIQRQPDNRAQIKVKQERVKELFINSIIDIGEYRSRIHVLENQITYPREATPPANTDRLKQLLETDILHAYLDLSREEKRAFWRSIVREVPIYRGKIVDNPIFL